MNVNLFRKALVKIPDRSGFDKSFMNMLTMPVGTLVPLVCDEVVPNSRINLSVVLHAQLPPLAVNSHLRCDIKLEAFFVPLRIVYGGFSYFIDGEQVVSGNGVLTKVGIPVYTVGGTGFKNAFGPGSLADYLGVKYDATTLSNVSTDASITISPLPFIAYHRIWDSWYRNKSITKPIFVPPLSSSAPNITPATLPFIRVPVTNGGMTSAVFHDNTYFTSLRQRCFGLDYFSSAKSSSQQGSPQTVSIDTSGSTGSFSISSLRAANSLQQFAERNNLCSDDYVDFLKVNYGSHLTQGQLNEPMYLGSGSVPVYNNTVLQTSPSDESTSQNPSFSVGTKYGNATSDGSVSLINDFHAAEPGYIFVIASLVPQASYGTGVDRKFLRYMKDGDQTNLANPVLQNTGAQPIFGYELNPRLFHGGDTGRASVFGYTDRYADFMAISDQVHGLVRDGSSLSVYALQRSFNDTAAPAISTAFGYIPTTYLDSILAVDSSTSNYGCIVDSYIDYKMSAPLQQFSIPSLENVSGEARIVNRGGTVIR